MKIFFNDWQKWQDPGILDVWNKFWYFNLK